VKGLNIWIPGELLTFVDPRSNETPPVARPSRRHRCNLHLLDISGDLRTVSGIWKAGSISITKIAEATRSDQDITGLMLRCAEGATTEVLVVLTKPLQLRTHPKVTVVAGATTTVFTASVVTPGVLVLLPEKASALVEHAWQSIPELAVAIAEDHRLLHGVISVADISTAMQTLQSNCPKALQSR
jgi:hypothetical protein